LVRNQLIVFLWSFVDRKTSINVSLVYALQANATKLTAPHFSVPPLDAKLMHKNTLYSAAPLVHVDRLF